MRKPYYHFYVKFILTLFLHLILANLLNAQQIKLSEIMFHPLEANSEFVEIYNISDAETIDITNYKIKYFTQSSDGIISLTSEYNLGPNQYAVIFEGDYDFENGTYKNMIPENALILKLDNNAFGNGGMANTSDRNIYLINSADDTLDIYTYSANNARGYSDERISISEKFWENSIIINGTPGKKNSVTPVEFDVALTGFSAASNNVIIGDSVLLNIEIRNEGTKTAHNFNIRAFQDKNKNSEPDFNEIIFEKNVDSLLTKDSLLYRISINEIEDGDNIVITVIEFSEDEFLDNNTGSINIKGITVNEVKGDILINEFMYAPKSPEPEWIEIYNRSEKLINLNNYKVADNSDTVTFVKSEIWLNPKEYAVFTDDSSFIGVYDNIKNLIIGSFPTLNNSGDDILILDSLNRIIDNLSYTSEWGGNNGNSLERIDTEQPSFDINNWTESIFPTPGFINSVTQKNYDLSIDTIITNPKFPLIDSKVKFNVSINNIGKNPVDFSISIFEDSNLDSLADKILETSIEYNIQTGDLFTYESSLEAVVSSTNSNFIFVLNTNDDDSTNNSYVFTLSPSYPHNSILINEIMYSPINFEPEWIELYNNSDYDIPLTDWAIGDILTNPVFREIKDIFTFPSKSYLVITKSRSIYDFHRTINSSLIELPFANLNNDEDGVVLKDENNRTIDSVKYHNNWGGLGGRSLERINFDFNSNNKNNWNNSIDLEGSTPGRINSITPKDFDLSAMSLSVEPKFPVKGDSVKVKVKISNFGKFDASDFSLEINFRDKYVNQLLELEENLSISSNDSLIYISNNKIYVGDTITVSAKIIFSLDQDVVNNIIEILIIPGFNSKTVLINEIMFKTGDGYPQWIELVNNSDSIINIKNWLIGDLSSHHIITEDGLLLNPEDFLIITEFFHESFSNIDAKIIETDLPNLSSTKDEVILYDFRNAMIDSTAYNVSRSFSTSTSLERISFVLKSSDPSNWSFSLSHNKSTPGAINSISELPNHSFGEIIFNEILFDPINDNSEFIEIFNNSNNNIEIGGWKIEDQSKNILSIVNRSFILNPNQYFIIAADSSIYNNYHWLDTEKNISVLSISSLNLPNDGKKIYLKNLWNNVLDSINYSSDWHNSALTETKNVSLELINPKLNRDKGNNWSSSVSEFDATPGLENSINVDNIASEARLIISPNPFSPDNDGFEDYTFINYNLTQPISQIRIRVYDSKGRFVRSIVNNQIAGSKGTILFDGLDENKNPLKIGIYIILFEAINTNNRIIEAFKEVVVVARKL